MHKCCPFLLGLITLNINILHLFYILKLNMKPIKLLLGFPFIRLQTWGKTFYLWIPFAQVASWIILCLLIHYSFFYDFWCFHFSTCFCGFYCTFDEAFQIVWWSLFQHVHAVMDSTWIIIKSSIIDLSHYLLVFNVWWAIKWEQTR